MKLLGVFYLRDSEPEFINIEKAIALHRERYHCSPTVCYFNTKRFPLDFDQADVLGIKIKTSPLVHPSMIWVGQEEL